MSEFVDDIVRFVVGELCLGDEEKKLEVNFLEVEFV